MMKLYLSIATLMGTFGFAATPIVAAGQQPATLGHAAQLVVKALPATSQTALTVTSPSFKQSEDIPYENTQYRGNIFPGLTWTAGPAGTKAYAIVVQGESLTRPGAATSIHLTLFNIPASVTNLKAGMDKAPAGSTYGPNVHGPNQAYAGPHTHGTAKNGYHYEVLALDAKLDLQPTVEFDTLVAAMTGHVLASGDLVGVSAKDPNATEAQAGEPEPTQIRIESGILTGVRGREPSITAYKGIPYAAPPVGELRFAAPKPPVPWEGVRKADQFGKMCPQGGGPGGGSKDNMSEDCLFANVWTGLPLATGPRPVFVWIYGGGFAGGAGSEATFDGEALAKKGLTVVTFNYRLGALGFLATPELSKESGHNASGNFGLLDDVALLQWVHKNIAAFGGDPNRVTIGGQSAGAGSVGFMAMSPLAKGLFQRAIEESHARYSRDTELRFLSVSWRPLKSAEEAGVKFQEEHGAHSIKDLRALPWEQLVVAGNLMDTSVETGSDSKPPLFRPVVDGWVIPKDYSETYASGTQNNVAVITGNNRDETGAVPESTFAQRRAAAAAGRSGAPGTNVTLAGFQAYANRKFGPLADDFLKLYAASNDDEAALQSNESVRDNSRISTYLWGTDWTRHATKPVYTYFWTHRPTGDPGGAHHASEILFVFNNLYLQKKDWTDEDKKVANTISSYWANFVATGDPNGYGLPAWTPYNPKSPTVMEIGDHFEAIPVASPAKLDFWKRFFQTQQPW